MKKIIYYLSLTLFPAFTFLLNAADIWITPVGTDGTGSGTPASPYVCSSGSTFDALIPSLPARSSIHLMAGKFLTGGNVSIPAGAKLRGAGIDVTVVEILTNNAFASRWSGISPTSFSQGFDMFIGQGNGTEISDFTIDCNLQNNASYSWTDSGGTNWSGICIQAAFLFGSDVKISRMKAINWGTTAVNVECPIFGELPLYDRGVWYGTNLLIEDCIVTQPAQVSFGNGADGFGIGGTPTDLTQIGGPGWINGAEIRNCRCYNIGTGSFGNPNYFNGIGVGNAVVGEKICGNLFINVGGTAVFSSCGSAVDCSIDHNLFINVSNGVSFAAIDYCPGATNSVKRNIRIADNLITVGTGGIGMSLSGIFGQPIDGLEVEANSIKAEDGSGSITALYAGSYITNLTVKGNTLDANGGTEFGLGPNIQVAQINNNQNIAGALVNPSGWVTTNMGDIFIDSGGNITLSASLLVNGSVGVTAGKAFQYDGVNMAFGITSLYDYFLGNAGNFTTTGVENTAAGYHAMAANSTGFGNTAIGSRSLNANTTGIFNEASGALALLSNTTGSYNAANGRAALSSNTTGQQNTATGDNALNRNTTGSLNTANGDGALYSNTNGWNNTADGFSALGNLTSGSGNIGLGAYAGQFVTGNNNIDIGNQGVSTDNNIIRIGDPSNHTDTFLAGVVHAPSNLAVGGSLSIGSTTISSFGLNLIGSSGVASALSTLGLPSNPSVILTSTNIGAYIFTNTIPITSLGGGGTAYLSFTNANIYPSYGFSSSAVIPAGWNNAFGDHSLASATTGCGQNEAFGDRTLQSLTNGVHNIAIGSAALMNMTNGSFNLALGGGALAFANGSQNNVGLGIGALQYSTNSTSNTAVGNLALENMSTGNNNIGVGYNAGFNLTTGNNNIDIGNGGLSTDTGIIRIGSSSQTDTYLTGIIHAPANTIVGGTLTVSNGISSILNSTQPATSVSISSSPFFWTNTTPQNLAVYVNGVTGSVGYNGSLLFGPISSAPVTVILQPGAYVSITNSTGTPVLRWHAL